MQRLSLKDNVIDSALSLKYLALGSFSALIKYVEFAQHSTFAAHSLKVRYLLCQPKLIFIQIILRGCEGIMFIDASSIRDLEVLFNKRSGKPDESLFGILNHTKTLQGGKKPLIHLIDSNNFY